VALSRAERKEELRQLKKPSLPTVFKCVDLTKKVEKVTRFCFQYICPTLSENASRQSGFQATYAQDLHSTWEREKTKQHPPSLQFNQSFIPFPF